MNYLKKIESEKNIWLGFREITPCTERNNVPFLKSNHIGFLVEGPASLDDSPAETITKN